MLASQASGKSKSYNLLRSEDVIDTLKCLKKLGIKVRLKKKHCEIIGKGLNKFTNKKQITLNAGNSGTLARLIAGLLIHLETKVKIISNSLSKRDFIRIIKPLKKFGAHFKSNLGKLLITVNGIKNAKPIMYFEKRFCTMQKFSDVSCLEYKWNYKN